MVTRTKNPRQGGATTGNLRDGHKGLRKAVEVEDGDGLTYVAKAKLDFCLLLDEADRRTSKAVSNSRSGIADLLVWVAKQHVSPSELHVVMEGTGVYHEQAALALADAGFVLRRAQDSAPLRANPCKNRLAAKTASTYCINIQ